jgi:fructokinase
VVNGRVLGGANAIAGEWGHNPLPLPDDDDVPLPACYCGRAGCIETYLSGPGMAADHARHNGAALMPEAIVAAAAAGDAACETTLQRYEARLARALAGVINLLDPDVIVLGGALEPGASVCPGAAALERPCLFGSGGYPPGPRRPSGIPRACGAAWLWPAG